MPDCGCIAEYRCRQCGNCLPHEHQRVLRVSPANKSRKFFVPDMGFVNPGWNDTPAGDDEWWWYHQVPGVHVADCWRRAIP